MLYGFAGLKRSGKNTAAKVLAKEFSFTEVAFADKLRQAAYALNPIIADEDDDGLDWLNLQELIDDIGWDEAKEQYLEVRSLMQRLGTEMGRDVFGKNFWVNQLDQTQDDWASGLSRYVVTDARFPNEAAWIHSWSGTLIWVDRAGLESDGHSSESTALRDLADFVVTNNGTQEEFENKIRLLVGTQLKHHSTSN